MRDVDTPVYGHKTYELIVPFRPDVAKGHSGSTMALNDFADAFASIDNIVVCSRSLKNVEGKNARIMHGDLNDEIHKLKQLPGGNIATGGVDIPSQLIALGLVDEFHFVIQPLLSGGRSRFLDDTKLPGTLHLNLLNVKVLGSGYVVLRYSRQ